MEGQQTRSSMASLVAYDDSDSEAEAEPAGSVDASGQMKDAFGVAAPLRQDFTSDIVDITKEGAQGTEHGSHEDPGEHRLPLVRLWRRDPGSCPSQRLQWPAKEPEVAFPTSEPSRSSPLWTCRAPAGHVPLATAHLKQVRLSWDSPKPSFCAPNRSEATGKNASSFQRKRSEACVIPYTPKRLRQLQAVSTETGQRKDVEAQGPSAACAPAPLCVAPSVSELIQPYLNSQCRETRVPRTVLFHLRGHRGPVNSIQWCPVLSRSHMLLSTSMDKTFKVWNAVDSGRCVQTYSLHSEAVRAARWSPCGGRILSGGFDFALHLTDLETGTQLFTGQSDFRITTLKFHPKDHSIFLCGGFSSEIKAWDIRTGKVVRGYKATIQQTLDILFLQEGSEFLSSTDASTRDSADRTIIAWDFRSSAKISNQIFHKVVLRIKRENAHEGWHRRSVTRSHYHHQHHHHLTSPSPPLSSLLPSHYSSSLHHDSDHDHHYQYCSHHHSVTTSTTVAITTTISTTVASSTAVTTLGSTITVISPVHSYHHSHCHQHHNHHRHHLHNHPCHLWRLQISECASTLLLPPCSEGSQRPEQTACCPPCGIPGAAHWEGGLRRVRGHV